MPDFYAAITGQPPEVVASITHAMETRAASPQQHAMLESYLAHISFSGQTRVLEVVCGSGLITKVMAQWPA